MVLHPAGIAPVCIRSDSSPVRRPVRLSTEHLRELQDAFTPLSIERGRHGSRPGAFGMAHRSSSACEDNHTPGAHSASGRRASCC